MHKTLMSLLVLSLLLTATVLLPAQEETKKPTAEAKFKTIMEDLTKSYQDWQKSEQEKMKKAVEAAEKAKAEGKDVPSMPAMRMAPPKEIFVNALKKLQAGAVEYKGQDDAIQFHAMVLQLAGSSQNKDAASAAATALTTEHIKSEKLAEVVQSLFYASRLLGKEAVNGYLATIAKDSPHASIRGAAILQPLRPALEDGKIGSAEYNDAKAKALAAAKTSENADMLAEVKAIISGRENVVAGKVAPDIAGVDLDGTAFKLSDYKGKVIMLDFWGDW